MFSAASVLQVTERTREVTSFFRDASTSPRDSVMVAVVLALDNNTSRMIPYEKHGSKKAAFCFASPIMVISFRPIPLLGSSGGRASANASGGLVLCSICVNVIERFIRCHDNGCPYSLLKYWANYHIKAWLESYESGPSIVPSCAL